MVEQADFQATTFGGTREDRSDIRYFFVDLHHYRALHYALHPSTWRIDHYQFLQPGSANDGQLLTVSSLWP